MFITLTINSSLHLLSSLQKYSAKQKYSIKEKSEKIFYSEVWESTNENGVLNIKTSYSTDY